MTLCCSWEDIKFLVFFFSRCVKHLLSWWLGFFLLRDSPSSSFFFILLLDKKNVFLICFNSHSNKLPSLLILQLTILRNHIVIIIIIIIIIIIVIRIIINITCMFYFRAGSRDAVSRLLLL